MKNLLFFMYLMNFGIELIASIDMEDPVFQDPGVYYAKSQVESRRRLKNNKSDRVKFHEDLEGSYSSKKKSKLKYHTLWLIFFNKMSAHLNLLFVFKFSYDHRGCFSSHTPAQWLSFVKVAVFLIHPDDMITIASDMAK